MDDVTFNIHDLNSSSLSESGQGLTPMKMTILNANDESIDGFLYKCKDYVGDYLYTFFTNNVCKAYGYDTGKFIKSIREMKEKDIFKMFFTVVEEKYDKEKACTVNVEGVWKEEFANRIINMCNLFKQEFNTDDFYFKILDNGIMINIPKQIWNNSYFISFWLYMIRLSLERNPEEYNTTRDLLNLMLDKEVCYSSVVVNESAIKMMDLKIYNNDKLLSPLTNWHKFTPYDIHNHHGVLNYNKELE